MKLKITDIKPNPDNPRTIKDANFKKLVQSLKDFPEMLEAREIVLNKDHVILGGNMRFKAAIEAGYTEVPVKVVDWSEDKQKQFIIKDNVSGGDWDWDILANEWDADLLDDWGLELPDSIKEPDEVEEDEAPEVDESEPPKSKLGEVYQLGRHRVMCADSTVKENVEKLMDGKKADMVFTDPPYGMAYESNAWDSKKNEVKQKRTDTQILNDENTNVGKDALNLIPLFLNNNRHFYIWCRWDCFNDFKEVCENIGKIKSVVIWDKGGPGLGDLKGSYGDSEWAIFGMIGRRELNERQNGVWQVNRMKGLQMQHPTQKPLEICERGINNSTEKNESILDLFLGSGSTLIACEQTDRTCYGMELDPKYVDVIRKRYWKFINNGNEEGWEENTPCVEKV